MNQVILMSPCMAEYKSPSFTRFEDKLVFVIPGLSLGTCKAGIYLIRISLQSVNSFEHSASPDELPSWKIPYSKSHFKKKKKTFLLEKQEA